MKGHAKSSFHGAHRKILMLTNVEFGEANVFLATSQALLEADPDVELHFATFDGLEKCLARITQTVQRRIPHARPIVLHNIKGSSMTAGVKQHLVRHGIPHRQPCIPDSFTTPLGGFLGSVRALNDTIPIFLPYEGPELADLVSSILDIMDEVDADLVVVNSLMTAGLTACYHRGCRFVSLSPNSLKAAVPRFGYPTFFSGLGYPVPAHLLPLNLCLFVYMVALWWTNGHRRRVAACLEERGYRLRTTFDLARDTPRGFKLLVSSRHEIDFPVACPSYIRPCGPIVRPTPPIADVDPGLAAWLAGGPTVYVNLGSLFRFLDEEAVALAHGLKIVLDTARKQPGTQLQLQVLWKLKRCQTQDNCPASKQNNCPASQVLDDYIRAGHVRIVDWIQAEPNSILRSGHVACSVHHGGANSFNEAVSAGVPHLVLPQWMDCYDYAEMAKTLGIGRQGNESMKPRWNAPELASQLLATLFGDTGKATRERAKGLARLCEERGPGAVNAARILLSECCGK
ncbi:glycosyltransferase family 1 protein [Ophiocordyceps sinensis CO18]|uniref:Glycosyltransferase family 1 protein n=1 Tax=Ophiocordyceps sinensis (strain Co18 / CGMCC 3.14243) TaxID=911162 RepID=T5AMX8_OPHSC|nr:glycosyltransferase family 1 protein [Ophiocordyceps sinensis CO18]